MEVTVDQSPCALSRSPLHRHASRPVASRSHRPLQRHLPRRANGERQRPHWLKLHAKTPKRKQAGFNPGLLWGVPIVTKANTSIKGSVTTDGWRGYMIPGHELVAPRDATIVARLRAAGAIIIGVTNMPDFAASDTNRSTAFGRTGNAYDVRFSPGGSSGGTVTSVTSNFAVLGNGTDTGNSIRMPVATSNLVGIFPTRGLVSIAGIAPLDWQLDNTGPIARDVTDAAIALTVMAGEDPLDPVDDRLAVQSPARPLHAIPQARRAQGKTVRSSRLHPRRRFAGIPGSVSKRHARATRAIQEGIFLPPKPETRAMFMKAVEELRAAGATVLIDPGILPDSFADEAAHICTLPYIREGTDKFLSTFGPTQYHSADEYEKAVGKPLPATIIGGGQTGMSSLPNIRQATLETDPSAEATLLGPRRRGAGDVRERTRPPPSRRLRLSRHPDASCRRNHAAGWPPQRRPALRHWLGQHAGSSSHQHARRLL